LEIQLQQTDIIIVKGLSPGNCHINAKLVEKDYKVIFFFIIFNIYCLSLQINPSSVRMYIMEHFAILPESEIYLLKKSLLKFKLVLIKRTETSSYLEKGPYFCNSTLIIFNLDINLPNPNYRWELDHEDLGEIQQTGLLRVKNELGTIRIIVNDTSKKIFDIIINKYLSHAFKSQKILLKILYMLLTQNKSN